MICPSCGCPVVTVVKTYDVGEGYIRTRSCAQCQATFKTAEGVVPGSVMTAKNRARKQQRAAYWEARA